MKLDIEKIKIEDRIRKDFGDINELAEDIKKNGLINPIVITSDYQLLAGERRYRACKKLGFKEVEVRAMNVESYEEKLNIEISENENRKDFSFSEKIRWAKKLERIEKKKAEKRKKATQNNKTAKKIRAEVQNFAEGDKGNNKGNTRDKEAGYSGFREYVEKELDYSRQRAYHFIIL